MLDSTFLPDHVTVSPAELLGSPRQKGARKLLVADLFCGAGGSSTGARKALIGKGLEMQLVAVNHWPVAIETHQKNHPDARHYCVNLESARPIELVPEGRLDLLMASPECTHHSRARGGKPVNDQSRMSAWHIVRWCTDLRVKSVLIENVVEFQDWGPVDPRTGRPLKTRKGEYFRAFNAAMQQIGFKGEWRRLNAADYGARTTRERLFGIFRSDGKPIRWPEATHSKKGDGDLFGGAKKWRPAREIIDWSIRGKSIYSRKRRLSDNTLRRIYTGICKFEWDAGYILRLWAYMRGLGIEVELPAFLSQGGEPDPALLVFRRHGDLRSTEEPAPTIVAGGTHLGLVQPFMLSRHDGGAPRSTEQPTPTQVAKHSHILVHGPEALIAPYYGSGSGETCSSTNEPLPTCTTKARFGIVVPVTQSGGGPRPRSIEEPLPTLTTAKGGEFGIVMPVTHGTDPGRVRGVDEPLPTVTCAPRGELAFIVAAFGERPGQAPRVHSIDKPTPTIPAKGRIQLAQAEIDAYDIFFRMLEPHELAGAMGFSRDESAYEFIGTKTQVTKQIGNAVAVEQAEALIGSIFA